MQHYFAFIKEKTIKILLLGRIPVPNGKACDWGLLDADSCTYCQQYYDPRSSYGNNENGKCVWVPTQKKCFPKSWAVNKLMPFDDKCNGNQII